METSQQFKDYQREMRLFRNRVIVMVVALLLLMGALIYRYYDLQINHYQTYATQSDRNRIHVQPVPPTRGLIFDRNGVILADNKPIYTLTVVGSDSTGLNETIERLKKIITISEADITKFHRLKKQARHYLDPVPLRTKLTEEEIARIAVNQHLLEGVEVEAELVRSYPSSTLFAHVVGYTGRISEKEMQAFTPEQIKAYSGTHSIGKIGIERSYEEILLGEVGSQNVETNARGRVMRVLDRTDPIKGKDISLHLDAAIQETAAAAMMGRRGALVAIEVETGGVVAALSNPGFDPNLFVTGISFADYKALNEDIDTPLINRFLQGQYPPGSTIKPLIGLAGLHSGATDPDRTIWDPGYFTLPGSSRIYRDWILAVTGGGHGRINLRRAIAESCDTYFWDMGVRTGVDTLHEVGNLFGLGELTGIDVPHERRGIWPSREWKRAARGQPWYPGDTVNMSIGQGYVLSTPMQLAVMTATIANKGKRIKPHFIRTIDGVVQPPQLESEVKLPQEHWDVIFGGMYDVMHGSRGTARRASVLSNYQMAGKSGTAQVVGIAQNAKYDSKALKERHRDHALFVAFAPLENPKIAVAVMLENAEGGSSQAAPVARRVMDAYLNGYTLKATDPVPPLGYHPDAIIDRANAYIQSKRPRVSPDGELVTSGAQ
ncbi:MAG: penicillin-binding protein 2 [Cellvibrio sp.]